MGYIYWYPNDTGTLEVLDLGSSIQDLQEVQDGEVEDHYGGGLQYRSYLGGWTTVRLVVARFGSESPGANQLERRLQTVLNHLIRGNPIGYSRDHGKAVVYELASSPSRGDTTVGVTSRQALYAWNSSAALVAGDEVALESGYAEDRTQLLGWSSITGTTVTLDEAVDYTWTQDVYLRWRDCWPVLFLPKDQIGQAIIRSDRRRNWTLDLSLRYSPTSLRHLFKSGNVNVLGDLKLSTTASSAGTYSLQTLLAPL